MTSEPIIYVPTYLRDLYTKIKRGEAKTCESIELTGDYRSAGVVSRVTSLEGSERNFSFYIAERCPADIHRPELIKARLINTNSTTGDTESALRTSSELRLQIRVKGYLEQDGELVFITEELTFEGRTFVHHRPRQACDITK